MKKDQKLLFLSIILISFLIIGIGNKGEKLDFGKNFLSGKTSERGTLDNIKQQSDFEKNETSFGFNQEEENTEEEEEDENDNGDDDDEGDAGDDGEDDETDQNEENSEGEDNESDEEDDDEIEEEIEEKNSREVDVSFEDESSQILINSNSSKGNNTIQLIIDYSEGELNIETNFKSYQHTNDSQKSEVENEIEFEIEFVDLIEYIDENQDEIFSEEDDEIIQTTELENIVLKNYTKRALTNQTYQYYVLLGNSFFNVHIYFAEEFTKVNDEVITPAQIKLAIEINNFNFLSSQSRLALLLEIETEESIDEIEDTEDEVNNITSGEAAVQISNYSISGFFSWKKFAIIDGVSSNITVNSKTGDEQKIIINYPRGDSIYHDPKIGIQGIIDYETITVNLPDISIIIIMLMITLTISVAATSYYYFHQKDLKKIIKGKSKIKKLQNLTENQKRLLNNLEKESWVKRLSRSEFSTLTALSPNFYQTINRLDWDPGEKENFIKEMISLSPHERDQVLERIKENIDLDD